MSLPVQVKNDRNIKLNTIYNGRNVIDLTKSNEIIFRGGNSQAYINPETKETDLLVDVSQFSTKTIDFGGITIGGVPLKSYDSEI